MCSIKGLESALRKSHDPGTAGLMLFFSCVIFSTLITQPSLFWPSPEGHEDPHLPQKHMLPEVLFIYY